MFMYSSIVKSPFPGALFALDGTLINLLYKGKATVKVLRSADKWYGVTYAEDKPKVTAGIQSLKDKGLYPEILWTK